MKIYVPFQDDELVLGAGQMSSNKEGARGLYVHGAGPKRPLAALNEKETLFLLAHGRYSRGDQIAGTVAGRVYGKRSVTLSAGELAAQLIQDGLSQSFGDLRLLVCWGGYTGTTHNHKSKLTDAGHTVTRKAGAAPFAGLLCAALKGKGFRRIIVTGYTGTVKFPTNKGVFVNKVTIGTPDGNSHDTDDKNSPTLMELLSKIAPGQPGSLTNNDRSVWY